MNESLRIVALQLDIAVGDVAENMRRADDAISMVAADVDLVVLPEMFTTGFITDRRAALLVADSGEVLTAVCRMARRYATAIVTSVIAEDDGRLFNRMYFIGADGEVLSVYDKHHLFAMSREAATFTAGESLPPVVSYQGFNIAMVVCYDLRFPVWMRNVEGRYDVMIVTACWPDARAYAWEHLLIARAIENQSYVVGCNRTGSDEWGVYSGTSMIVSPKGLPIHKTTAGNGVGATLSLDELTSFRKKFPVYLHGDKFSILQ